MSLSHANGASTVEVTLLAIIAIDGPAASGKSTVGSKLAERLGYLFFDTGIMYRAVTWAALIPGAHDGDPAANVESAAAMTVVANAIEIDVRPPQPGAPAGNIVLVDGREVTELLHTPAVDRAVSAVSAHAGVRTALSAQQRRIGLRYATGLGEKPGIVMTGRDIGTIVFPEAPLKVYLDATAEERARRRHADQLRSNPAITYEQVLADIVRRDHLDSKRALSPLRPADDALVIDTSNLTQAAVVLRILELAAAKGFATDQGHSGSDDLRAMRKRKWDTK